MKIVRISWSRSWSICSFYNVGPHLREEISRSFVFILGLCFTYRIDSISSKKAVDCAGQYLYHEYRRNLYKIGCRIAVGILFMFWGQVRPIIDEFSMQTACGCLHWQRCRVEFDQGVTGLPYVRIQAASFNDQKYAVRLLACKCLSGSARSWSGIQIFGVRTKAVRQQLSYVLDVYGCWLTSCDAVSGFLMTFVMFLCCLYNGECCVGRTWSPLILKRSWFVFTLVVVFLW